MIGTQIGYLNREDRKRIEDRYIKEMRKQPGVAFPSATNQEHIFIIRFDISNEILDNSDSANDIVRTGLRNLCGLFDKIARDEKKINELTDDGDLVPRPLSRFKFTATIGFGAGFFKKLNIDRKNWPKKMQEEWGGDEGMVTSAAAIRGCVRRRAHKRNAGAPSRSCRN